MSRNVLIVIGIMSLCGVGFITTGWWGSLTDVQRAQLFGQSLAVWFCCGGPFVGGLAGWWINNWRRAGWQIKRPQSNLKAEDL